MADLNNLLDELEEADDEDEIENVGVEEETNEGNNDDVNNNNNSSSNQQLDDPTASAADTEPAVPLVLAEAVAKSSGIMDDDSLKGEDEDNEFTKNKNNDNDALMNADGSGYELDNDYKRLRSMWVRELNSPEIMPNPNDTTISLEIELLSDQEKQIERYASQQADSQNNKNHNEIALLQDITKLDSERVKFVIEDLITARLEKIEDHALYNRDMIDRMTEEEVDYLKSYGELYEKYMNRTVLDHIPSSQNRWKQLDEPGMITSPNLDSFVFCRVLEDNGVDIDNTNTEKTTTDEDVTMSQTPPSHHECGACLIVSYSSIQAFVIQGKVELIM